MTTTFKQKLTLIAFGLGLFLLIIESALRLAGFTYLAIQEARNNNSLIRPGAYRILCLGDSNTAFGGDNSYPSQLELILNQRFPGVHFSVINKGIGGADTGMIITRLEYNLKRYQPNMVIAMMGINDREELMIKDKSITRYIKNTLKPLRVYKLARLLRIHVKAKLYGVAWLNNYYYQLGADYSDIDNYAQAERIFMKMIDLVPKDKEAYLELGFYYDQQKKYALSETAFKKVIELNPKIDAGYLGLAWQYQKREDYLKAEEMFKKAIEANPQDESIYVETAFLYKIQKKYALAEEMLKQAVAVNHGDDTPYIELGRFYFDQKKYLSAEDMFKTAIQLNPKYEAAYLDLARCYLAQAKLVDAEEMFKKAIQVNPKVELVYLELENYYRLIKDYAQAQEISMQLKETIRNSKDYHLMTRRNFQKLKGILLNKGIKLVCAQYPMRSLTPLKMIFDSTDGIVFVDNQEIFKQAVRNSSYDDYFMDRFAGDYGHCTPKGNYLLASNVADVIIREYFEKALRLNPN